MSRRCDCWTWALCLCEKINLVPIGLMQDRTAWADHLAFKQSPLTGYEFEALMLSVSSFNANLLRIGMRDRRRHEATIRTRPNVWQTCCTE